MGVEQPSHLRAAARLVAAGLLRRGVAAVDSRRVPTRKVAVERRGIETDPSHVRRYLEATRGNGYDDIDNLEATLPPTYSAVWETALTLELLAMQGMPFPSAGLVHLRSELVVLRALQIADRVRCRVELGRAEARSRGTRLSLKCRSWNAVGHLCQENTTELLVLSRGAREGRESQRTQDEQEKADGRESAVEDARSRDAGDEKEVVRWRELSAWDLARNAGLRYARASGDFNPIHLWPWSSRLFGFSQPILHGHCSMAMIAQELTRGPMHGSDSGLRMIDATFRSPLALPARVRFFVAEGREGGGKFRLVAAGGNEEQRPYVEGRYVG